MTADGEITLLADDINIISAAVGRADDIAVVGLALKFVEPEVKAYKAWREGRR